MSATHCSTLEVSACRDCGTASEEAHGVVLDSHDRASVMEEFRTDTEVDAAAVVVVVVVVAVVVAAVSAAAAAAADVDAAEDKSCAAEARSPSVVTVGGRHYYLHQHDDETSPVLSDIGIGADEGDVAAPAARPRQYPPIVICQT